MNFLYKIKTSNQKYNCFSLADLLTNLDLSKQSLLLIRGLPGSTKSTTAKAICEKFNNLHHFEADMYFQQGNNYNFDKTKLSAAHEWCYNQTINALQKDCSVCVANTFVKKWEMEKYINAAKSFKTELIIIECLAEYSSIHGVPEETIERMRRQWESL